MAPRLRIDFLQCYFYLSTVQTNPIISSLLHILQSIAHKNLTFKSAIGILCAFKKQIEIDAKVIYLAVKDGAMGIYRSYYVREFLSGYDSTIGRMTQRPLGVLD